MQLNKDAKKKQIPIATASICLLGEYPKYAIQRESR